MLHILFVCTGNTCRSPMAEGLLRKLAKERGIELEVRSAGVSAISGTSVSRHAAAILREIVNWADLVLTLTGGHKRHLLQYFPSAVSKTHTLKEYVYNEEAVNGDIRELDSLYAEAELNLALGKEPKSADLQRIIEIRHRHAHGEYHQRFHRTHHHHRWRAGRHLAG